ncbi:Cytochrome oxidase biogenesis protein Sco1/SenC/PrrC, thiol-disulfide reductase involved in Cu(I) insertion into CoxII Cu(A) center / Cytochrome c [hydrothermal vent metagenome]|uniref:Cytochrome oxidase biogenesis protein Sco1/SenC/PrrC, thiol-disulfide reductase involved in Cu(I) insertion into CoxII Cu(A) center / Cytochrome c n=1 Tax=hydrothermal vent metagenome TaxID=652676 RepID=A0A3B0X2T4_9ZZZZ
MYKRHWVAAIALFVICNIATISVASPWGASYFPNVPLTTHEGKEVRFFDDLIKDKIVAINFIYTSCPDTCPLETAQLVRVQKILGDRVGKDVFFYSISIDPKTDTPEVLKEYRERFGAKWTFLTGKKEDIILLRKKLGLYISEIQDGSNNHNVNMIIGNQKTGRWMKRSPFENVHLLADQLGNWLSGWKKKQVRTADYAEAPELRNIPRGEQIYRTRCSTCHTLTGKELAGALGPDLLGVTQRREKRWLYDWLKAPDQMLKKKDPIAMEMYERYNKLAMPNMRLNKKEAEQLLDYIDDETQRLTGVKKPVEIAPIISLAKPGDVVAVMDSWVREAHEKAKVNAGYMILANTSDKAITLDKIESDIYKTIEVHQMVAVDGMMEMQEVKNLTIPANGQINFVPGGKHLMLIGPKEHLKTGQKVDLTLLFKSGKKQSVTVKVAAK